MSRPIDWFGVLRVAILAAACVWMVLLAGRAFADTVDLTWTPPTQRVDGSALATTEIAGYRLSWSINGAAQTDKTVPAGSTYTLDTGALVGRVCVVMRTVDTDGLESDPTAEVCRKARPRSPGSLRAR